MKKVFLTLLVTLAFTAFAQAQTDDSDTSTIFVIAETSAEYPGGLDSLQAFIQQNIIYPEEAVEKRVEGNVYVKFVVEKDGSLSHMKVIRDIGSGCGEAAIEVLNKMPNWIPATVREKPVRFQFILPIKFALKSEQDSALFQVKECDSAAYWQAEAKRHARNAWLIGGIGIPVGAGLYTAAWYTWVSAFSISGIAVAAIATGGVVVEAIKATKCKRKAKL